MDKTGLIPARFITMIGHFVMLIMAMNCRDTNVRACLPYNYDNEDYIEKDRELLIGIIIALAFLGAEMFGFLFGFSMFIPLIGTISVAGHFSACVSLSYWLIDTWDCVLFCSLMDLFMLLDYCFNFISMQNKWALHPRYATCQVIL